MKTQFFEQRTIEVLRQDYYLSVWIDAFIWDRLARGLSKKTAFFYQVKLQAFLNFCETRLVKSISQITPDLLRDYLLFLQERGHNPGGCHAAFRSIRAFLLWWESEVEPEHFKNPIRKVKAPKVALEPLEPADPKALSSMIEKCHQSKFTGARDKALFLSLIDTGCRASEFLDIDLADIDLINGTILLRQTKSKKPRSVFISKPTRKALRNYLAFRNDRCSALWISDEAERLTYNGLRSLFTRRAKQANVPCPSPHSFRRLFALTMLRNGVNIYSLQMLMGHSDLQVLRRYLKETDSDLRKAHEKGNPIESIFQKVNG